MNLFLFLEKHTIITDINTKLFFKDGIPTSASSGHSKDMFTTRLLDDADIFEMEEDKTRRQAWI